MRVYSASQGKFIDTADQQTGVQTNAGVDTTQSSNGMTSIGVPDEKLRNAFFQLGLAKPSNAGNLKTLYDFVKPNTEAASARKERLTAQDKQQALDKGNKTIDTIYKYWKTGIASSVTNRVSGALSSLTGIRSFNPAHARIQAEFFANLEPELRKALVSGRITQQEIKWLQDNLIPNYTDSTESANQKINALKTAFRSYVAEPGQAIGTNTVSPKSNSWEVIR